MMPVVGDIISEPKERLIVLVTATALPTEKFNAFLISFGLKYFTFVQDREVSGATVLLVVELSSVVSRV